MNRKAYLSLLGLLFLFLAMSYLLFKEHWRDIAPTPKPTDYQEVALGVEISLDDTVFRLDQAVFLHFTNPACRCSDAIRDHLRPLVKNYSARIQFGIVIESEAPVEGEAERAQWEAALGDLKSRVRFLQDRDGRLARRVGVFSTPQAAIVSEQRRLFFRGGYSEGRYSSQSRGPKYAKIALDAFLTDPRSDGQSLKSGHPIGCVIPSYR